LFNTFDELPLPSYLERDCQKEFENRFLLRVCVNQEQLASLSKHELLFGLRKSSRYWHAGVLQIVELTVVICSAWTLMALCGELSAIVQFVSDTQTSSQIALRLIMPIVRMHLVAVSYKLFADWLPEALCAHAVSTSTEMMKDRGAIEAVIQKQKGEKNERNYRVFQAMRLMRREYMKMLFVDNLSEDGCGSEYGEDTGARTIASESILSELPAPMVNKRLKEVTVKHIQENF